MVVVMTVGCFMQLTIAPLAGCGCGCVGLVFLVFCYSCVMAVPSSHCMDIHC